MDRYEEALADFNRAIDLNPSHAWAIASRGQTYQAMDRYEEALADFNRAIDLNPNLASEIGHLPPPSEADRPQPDTGGHDPDSP
jgi:tetratricopeptide (TPR) repeat protein